MVEQKSVNLVDLKISEKYSKGVNLENRGE